MNFAKDFFGKIHRKGGSETSEEKGQWEAQTGFGLKGHADPGRRREISPKNLKQGPSSNGTTILLAKRGKLQGLLGHGPHT